MRPKLAQKNVLFSSRERPLPYRRSYSGGYELLEMAIVVSPSL
jgi:hypothetical protein